MSQAGGFLSVNIEMCNANKCTGDITGGRRPCFQAVWKSGAEESGGFFLADSVHMQTKTDPTDVQVSASLVWLLVDPLTRRYQPTF